MYVFELRSKLQRTRYLLSCIPYYLFLVNVSVIHDPYNIQTTIRTLLYSVRVCDNLLQFRTFVIS